MKNIFKIQKLIFFVVLLTTAITACKKTETITVQQPIACYTIHVLFPYSNFPFQISSTYIDSNFYFHNCSDSGVNITYHWNFGDGTSSTEKNPRHSYTRRGTYPVTLIVSNENRAYDSVQQTVTVISGQKHISFGDWVNVYPVAIEEMSTNEFLLLGSRFAGNNIYSFYLFRLDSLLNQKSMKTFPSNFNLTSMQSTTDGNYIFTGSTQAANKSNEIIKMNADGTILWNKVLSTDDSYTYAAPTPDGGYSVIGTRPTPGYNGNTTVVIKTENNGNQQWQKILDQEGMVESRNAVIQDDGIIVAGIKPFASATYNDSLLIVKLNNAGNVIWQNTVLCGLNTNNWLGTRITKLKNGNYAVTNDYTKGIFFFSPSGNFLDRKLVSYGVLSVTNSGDGNLIVLQTEFGNSIRMRTSKLTFDGFELWYSYPDDRQVFSGGSYTYSCCSNSWAVVIHPLRNGGFVVTGTAYINNSTGSFNHSVILLLELDESGNQK